MAKRKKRRKKLPESKNKRKRVLLRNVLLKPFSKRMYSVIYRFAGRKQLRLRIQYKRIQDGEINTYEIEPYSFRYRRTREGIRKMLMGFHEGNPDGSYQPDRDNRIHNFAIKNILKMTLLDRIFLPRWKVEIK